MFLFFLLASGILEVLSYWHPHQHTSWNDVIGETHINTGIHGDVYVIDLFEHHGLIPELIRLYIYICKCFSLYDINNEIDVQFCMNTFDHVISFFSMRMNTIFSLHYIWVIVLLSHSNILVVRKENT